MQGYEQQQQRWHRHLCATSVYAVGMQGCEAYHAMHSRPNQTLTIPYVSPTHAMRDCTEMVEQMLQHRMCWLIQRITSVVHLTTQCNAHRDAEGHAENTDNQ
jgi:hypothetical protein